MQNDPLASALSTILNAERLGKKSCTLRPVSTQITTVLKILGDEGYVGEAKTVDDSRGQIIDLALTGSINKCGAIKPRFAVQKSEFESFEKRFLPARDFGVLIVSTSKGMMTHTAAKTQGLGGKLIAYCY